MLKKFSSFFNKIPPDWFEIDITGWGDSGNIHFFSDLKTAIIDKRVIEFGYHNIKGEKSFRRVEPVKLWFKSRSWYLRGFCLTNLGVRLFKLTRMRNLTVTDTACEERNLLAHELSGEPAVSSSNRVTLVLKITPEMAYRVYDYFNDDEIVIRDDGSATATSEWEFENNELYGFILSFGEYAEVLEPAHLKPLLIEKGRKIIKKYTIH